MSDNYSRHFNKTSRRHKEDSTKSKSRINSYQSDKKYEQASKTPPLPTKNLDMEELLKKRHSLKEELQRLEKNRDKDSKSKHESRESRKRKYFDETVHEKKDPKLEQQISLRKLTKTRELSPNYKDFHIDSEDEESIIEQRRKERKQLLEKFSAKAEKYENKNNEENYLREKETDDDLFQNCVTDKCPTKETNDISATDMFSEKDDFVQKNIPGTVIRDENNSQLTDNWDDSEGYYNIRSGDVIDKRYILKDILGKGVFANVVRAQHNQNNTAVAIKIIRNNELMYKTSLKEISILKEINEADPENKHHCVKFIGNFMHKGHLCLVLESLHMDLRAVLKKYGRSHGIHMKALVSYSRQLLLALRLLKKIGIIHADIKPDNILVNEKKNVLKLCDFGSAAKLDENEPTPYLVSRFYRAPEIILGVPYNHAIDIWSAACTFHEMATGKILFTGSSNNRMLKCFMDLKGKIPTKLIRKGKFKDQHFNYNNNFLLHKKDEFTGRDKVVEISNNNIVRDLFKELQKSCKNLSPGEEKKLSQLRDLLDKMLILDSHQRYSVTDCLRHPFIREELEK